MAEHDECELVIWQDGQWRCEYWRVGGSGVLRLYETDDLVREVACRPGRAAAEQAALWRADVHAVNHGGD